MPDQAIVFSVLFATLVLLILDRWRYDVVALLALLTLAFLGIVPASQAFSGFGHPAVVTVAAVLVVSQGLAQSGLVDSMSRLLSRVGSHPIVLIGALTTMVAFFSAFMNNVGALALLMPVALKLAADRGLSPSLLLMPLSFGSLLGGMTTLIGTPPNIIVASFRTEFADTPYGLFDYSPVGLVAAVSGIAFISLVGWRLIPLRAAESGTLDVFEIPRYTTELRVPEDSSWVGSTVQDLASSLKDVEFVIVTVLRNDQHLGAVRGDTILEASDSLVTEIDPRNLQQMVDATGFQLEGHRTFEDGDLRPSEHNLTEAVVRPRSRLVGRTAAQVDLRARHGLNLLAVARQGSRIRRPLKEIRFQPGDVLLVQSLGTSSRSALGHLGCLPLAQRRLEVGRKRRIALAVLLFGAAVLALLLRIAPAHVAFTASAVAMVLAGLVDLRRAYEAIDWPVIVLLGAMIPVGTALEDTGGAALIASQIEGLGQQLPLSVTLILVLVLAMVLSDVMNNAATAVIMAPIAIQTAISLDANPDSFLMAVAIGASCAFLTPIGHQSNTLVLGPGGYRFGDYWRLGLPLQIVLLFFAIPVLLWVWG
ncbi:MAG: SLC13 family permease [Acidobacteriota bacterium]